MIFIFILKSPKTIHLVLSFLAACNNRLKWMHHFSKWSGGRFVPYEYSYCVANKSSQAIGFSDNFTGVSEQQTSSDALFQSFTASIHISKIFYPSMLILSSSNVHVSEAMKTVGRFNFIRFWKSAQCALFLILSTLW